MNKKLLLIIFAALAFSACKKDFLDTKPTNAVPDDQVFSTADNVETVLNGTWSYMFEEFFSYAVPGYKSINLTSDAMGSDVAVISSYGFSAAYGYTEMNDNTKNRVSAYWTILYKVIDNCNNIIARVDNATGDDSKKQRLKGQAYALRANCYLTLASFYQFNKTGAEKAVPIYTTPSGPTSVGKPKATIGEVYKLVIDDLQKALPLLKDYQRSGTQKWKIDASVVNGLLARAYLYNRQWPEAITSAIAARNGYPLMSGDEYNKGFSDISNGEWIWGHAQTPNQSNASYNFHFLDVSTPASYYQSFMADPYFKNFFDSADVRFRLFDWDTLPDQEGFLRYKKFRFRDPGALIGDLVLMRSAEMYLIEAEAYAQNGNTGKAAAALNVLRDARSATHYTGNGSHLVDTILVERRKELWGEGFSLSDIIRTGGTVVRKPFLSYNGQDSIIRVPRGDGSFVEVAGQGHQTLKQPDGTAFTPYSNFYLFAIPITEVQNNPNLNN
ncbi:SusD-like starch-binding protein associating with outer membrane [Chitinophaga polysaccharea]|uniref:SusD-like starch-binding protein associating with outer membrane n=1 Tax=Chitinophaga polysaccharea TaxID=1293035 RepID=A0A561PWE9_9BACT|nr:RagB/SusD family nutrient uptake outer membrane protein [Chitinophaga polysaccharea]TWF42398.1 SusD-like starch-binding protein associating with outer membrane [Chitinophaga polysaccharea]